MKFASLLVLGTVVVSTVAQETTTNCSLVCSDEFEPVCGSDDITYQNECNMNLANCENPDTVTKAHDGECNISGSASWMAAMNDGPTMESVPMDAIPTDDACSDVCPTIYKPVCGSNGETYSNDCTLAFAQCTSAGAIIKASEGECPGHSSSESTECSEVCIEILKPVCGSDGITYPNSCFLGIATCKDPSVTQVSEGECPKEPESGNAECSEVCITIFQPVCGSDGVTYPNSCFLGIATCKDPSVTFVSDGECSKTYGSGNEDAECSEVCTKILKPVCGSDGITYPNSCFLDIATCKDPSITQVKEGACTTNEGNYDTNSSSTDSNEETTEDTEKPSDEYAPSCPDVCLTIYSPVCGSDGVTYSNSCKLGIASCNHPELHLTKVSDGSCSSECKTQL